MPQANQFNLDVPIYLCESRKPALSTAWRPRLSKLFVHLGLRSQFGGSVTSGGQFMNYALACLIRSVTLHFAPPDLITVEARRQ